MRFTEVLQHITYVQAAAWLCDGFECATAVAAVGHVWKLKDVASRYFLERSVSISYGQLEMDTQMGHSDPDTN